MVSAVVAASINEIVAFLRQEDFDSAQRHSVRLLAVLDEVPDSTAELIGNGHFADLRNAIEKGLWEITNGDGSVAANALQAGLNGWYETYPPYQA
jgi:hypothetical protein